MIGKAFKYYEIIEFMEGFEKPSIVRDLVQSVPAATGGILIGCLSAFIYPKYLRDSVNEIRNGGISMVQEFSYYVLGLTTYGAAVTEWVVKPIIRNPSNPESYIGLGLNVLSGGFQVVHKRMRKSRVNEDKLEERIFSDKVSMAHGKDNEHARIT